MDEFKNNDADAKPAYEIGYGRPPKHTRFQRGKSGNPSGKRKSAVTTAHPIEKALTQRMAVTENGRRKRVDALTLIVKRVRQMALGGNMQAVKYLLDRSLHLSAVRQQSDVDEYDLSKLTKEELLELQRIMLRASPDGMEPPM